MTPTTWYYRCMVLPHRNVKVARQLDVRDIVKYSDFAVFNANMIYISDRSTCAGLMRNGENILQNQPLFSMGHSKRTGFIPHHQMHHLINHPIAKSNLGSTRFRSRWNLCTRAWTLSWKQTHHAQTLTLIFRNMIKSGSRLWSCRTYTVRKEFIYVLLLVLNTALFAFDNPVSLRVERLIVEENRCTVVGSTLESGLTIELHDTQPVSKDTRQGVHHVIWLKPTVIGLWIDPPSLSAMRGKIGIGIKVETQNLLCVSPDANRPRPLCIRRSGKPKLN